MFVIKIVSVYLYKLITYFSVNSYSFGQLNMASFLIAKTKYSHKIMVEINSLETTVIKFWARPFMFLNKHHILKE
jgi:hypothetical protein